MLGETLDYYCGGVESEPVPFGVSIVIGKSDENSTVTNIVTRN